jgi:hypothetical protein
MDNEDKMISLLSDLVTTIKKIEVNLHGVFTELCRSNDCMTRIADEKLKVDVTGEIRNR